MTDTAWKSASLPLRHGGLGLTLSSSIHDISYLSSVCVSASLVTEILSPTKYSVAQIISGPLTSIKKRINTTIPQLMEFEAILSRIEQDPGGMAVIDLQNEITEMANDSLLHSMLYSSSSVDAIRNRVRQQSIQTRNAARPFSCLPYTSMGTRIQPEVWATMIQHKTRTSYF